MQPLLDLLHELRQQLASVTGVYETLQPACNEAEASGNQVSKKSHTKRSKVQIGRRVVQIGGGAAATGIIAGGAATGITLSIVAGVFTFGVGTIVGLSLTAAGTAIAAVVIGGGTVAGTHFAARHLRKISKHFREIETAFNSLSGNTSNLSNNVGRVESLLQRAADELESIDYCHDHQMLENICTALDDLSNSCRRLYLCTSDCRENLREIDELLKEEVAALYTK